MSERSLKGFQNKDQFGNRVATPGFIFAAAIWQNWGTWPPVYGKTVRITVADNERPSVSGVAQSEGKPSFGDPSAEFYFVRGTDLCSMTNEELIAFFTALFEHMLAENVAPDSK